MVWWWWILPAAAAVLGLGLVVAGLGLLFRARLFGGGARLLVGALLLAVGAAGALLGMDVQTYRRLTYERPVATLELKQTGPRLFEATLTQPATAEGAAPATAKYPIHGDEWRVEARVLKWKPWANVLGLDSQYRLDRLSGRYADTESELHAERSVYDLRPANSNLDLWAVARSSSRYAPVVDTLYGSGASMPMADGGKYEVWLTQGGLLARPANAAANQAMATGWR